MILKSVRVENYCAVRDATLNLDALTALVGPNGAGKSSLLRAAALLFGPTRGLTIEDVYNRSPSAEIRITATFANLSQEVTDAAGDYVEHGELTITKIISFDGKPHDSYHGYRRINPEFDDMRRVPVAEMAKQYRALRSTAKYATLPDESTKKAILPALEQWEREHPEACERGLDAGDFFGLETGTFRIKDHIEFVLIPAVRDASEDTSDGGFVVTLLARLAETLVLEAEATQTAFGKAKADVLATIKPSENQVLADAAAEVNATLKSLAPTAEIRVSWAEADMQLVPPTPSVEIGEDSYCTSVERTGHGVQRALVISILQHQAAHADEGKVRPKHLILAIEEPELYQHPNRQRHLADVLHKLALGSTGVTERTQVILATHSPLFVHLDYFDSVRRVYKEKGADDAPPATHLVHVDMQTLADALAALDGRPPGEYTAESLRARLRAVMTPWMNEGFFARKLVLVEGESDRAALLAVARKSGINLEEQGVSVIPSNGKSQLEKPYLVFTKLRIPTYVMWDADYEPPPAEGAKNDDREKSARENRKLLALAGAEAADFPDGVFPTHAVHKRALEDTLKEETGEDLYNKVMADAAAHYGYSKFKEVLKSPQALEHALGLAIDAGAKLDFLPRVLSAVQDLN